MVENQRSEKEILKSIESKLDRLIGVTAIQGKENKLQAKILKSLGFRYREVSELTGIAEGTLKTWDHQAKKRRR